ncbi:S-adenosylmethionine:tRNA ribosyltransferase-isomerase [Balneicella halophila]|uniref:S-adenosylmethionine:tRNA ribosyltransferase-isomerase n=1 Tax=Balneicella halophila TaxID=1537566 RepID=A0A7L4UQ92_BALHA|nr:S-adenosylmethionine:tRNA ribosyltransferase-isomerase [Balneicella halophila]PVX49910.1 S-adenosylmethionine:tRNA ribosyltransferase-isomerase [Balneicella halophila]
MQAKNIRIKDYNYPLPENRIAKYPLPVRDESKLLVYNHETIQEHIFRELPAQLPENSLLVFNTTKVIRARLQFKKSTGAVIEIFCLEPFQPSDYALALQAKNTCQWKCLIGNLKRWKESEIALKIDNTCTLKARIIERKEDAFIIQFDWNETFTFSQILEKTGAIPIPPYLNRASEEIDTLRYQTVFSKYEGSVAAPTAGLHFTPELLEKLPQNQIDITQLTLHVGAGTFKPVKTETIGEHHMHTEVFSFSIELLDKILEYEHIVAVGTTAVRSLESIYQIGAKLIQESASPLHISQWESYELPKYNKDKAINAIKNHMKSLGVNELTAKTDILIAPGYDFHIISGMLTNFHQPQSTLLLLVSALVGDKWKEIYDYALKNNFRFLSYGDSSLLFKS